MKKIILHLDADENNENGENDDDQTGLTAATVDSINEDKKYVAEKTALHL